MLAGGPLEAPVRPQRLETSTRRTGSAEAVATTGTETGGRDNSGLRRSDSRREQRNGVFAAVTHATVFARTPKHDRPEKDCALRRNAKTNFDFSGAFNTHRGSMKRRPTTSQELKVSRVNCRVLKGSDGTTSATDTDRWYLERQMGSGEAGHWILGPNVVAEGPPGRGADGEPASAACRRSPRA
jgi:hypothetical protein